MKSKVDDSFVSLQNVAGGKNKLRFQAEKNVGKQAHLLVTIARAPEPECDCLNVSAISHTNSDTMRWYQTCIPFTKIEDVKSRFGLASGGQKKWLLMGFFWQPEIDPKKLWLYVFYFRLWCTSLRSPHCMAARVTDCTEIWTVALRFRCRAIVISTWAF